MLIRRQTTNLLQIFCEILLYFQVIFKSMKAADDISRGTRECEWGGRKVIKARNDVLQLLSPVA